jgi:hypothetical protein
MKANRRTQPHDSEALTKADTVALWHAVSNYELMIKQMPAIEGLSPEMIEAERARLAVAKNALRKVNRLRAKQTRS